MNDFVLPFEETNEFVNESQKMFVGSYGSSNLFGFPSNAGGLDRKSNFAFTKRGVALAYMTVPVLKAAVDVIAENLAATPMVLKDKDGKIVQRSDGFGGADSLFLNAIEKSYSHYGVPLMQLWGTSLLLYGENFTEKVPNTLQKLAGLKWLNPLAMSITTQTVVNREDVVIGGNEFYQIVKTFNYAGLQGYIAFDECDILFSRAYNPIDDIHGFSSALAALAKASISMEFEDFTLAFYNNSGHPGVIISPKDKLVNNKDVNSWQKDWEEKFRGSHNQFKTHINSFPFDVYTFDVLDISQPLEVSKDAEHKILASFRVPPEMIGMTQDNAYQFSKETKNGFMQTAVRPLALSIANSINHSGIINEFEGVDSTLKFSFDFSEYDAKGESDLRQQDILERQVKSTAISLGDYQRATGNKVSTPEADTTYMIPQGFVLATTDELKNPSEITKLPDVTGPETNSMNQKPRETQSVTEEQESVEYFGSKYIGSLNSEDKDDIKSKISIKEIQQIAAMKGISLSQALDIFEEFDDDY